MLTEKEDQAPDATIEIWVPGIKCSADSSDDGDWIVSGPVASPDEDFDGDIFDQSGVRKGLETFKRLNMPVDWEHRYGVTHNLNDVIGQGVEVFDGPDGRPWLSTKLDKTNQKARDAWNWLKQGKPLGYSLEGDAFRDPKNKKVFKNTVIKRVAIALQPKGFEKQFLVAGRPYVSGSAMAVAKSLASGNVFDGEEVSKAMLSGSGIVSAGDAGGQALRSQWMAGRRRAGRKGKRRRDLMPYEHFMIRKSLSDVLGEEFVNSLSAQGVSDDEFSKIAADIALLEK